ncbi:hypothetical protein HRED_02895 [Candidatus Haloredivivus sp. G17]|nr:hypothetical protein HRED_02895 [Candidatus Haloredivivus sp. G17]
MDDGSQTDFDSILPGTLERKDYNGTGTYLNRSSPSQNRNGTRRHGRR